MDHEGESGPLAVVLLQLGGPQSLADIQPFLQSMFEDPGLFDIPMPGWLRSGLARRLSTWRAKKTRPLYESIGGGSPIAEITRRQAAALERSLNGHFPCRVIVAMRYSKPSTESAVKAVLEAGCGRLLLLPMYPQYCVATTGSSFREWDRESAKQGLDIPTLRVKSYYAQPQYIQAVGERLDQALQRLPRPAEACIVFSAHGLPEKFVRKGDPYQLQIEETVRLVMQNRAGPSRFELCYQSRIGPQRWLRPSLDQTLRHLGQNGTDSVVTVPISFVSDHLETLSEIDIEAREFAARSGIRHFETAEGLNDSPAFIAALAQAVLRAVTDGGPS